VVASRIGGIQDQIVDGKSGILLDDPTDLPAYGDSVRRLLEEPERARSIGREAQERVRDEFLAGRSLMRYRAGLPARIASGGDGRPDASRFAVPGVAGFGSRRDDHGAGTRPGS
jgi:glycosyl transferase family 1